MCAAYSKAETIQIALNNFTFNSSKLWCQRKIINLAINRYYGRLLACMRRN